MKQLEQLQEIDKHKSKSKKFIEAVANFNTIVAIMLALCALTTAWASWVGDLHASDQDSNYALADRLNTEANASYNLCAQTYIAAFNVWTHVFDLNEEIKELESADDTDTQGANSKRDYMNRYIEANCPNCENFKAAIYTALEKGGTATPFDEYPESSFFAESDQISTQATETREEGDRNNLASDSYGLVSLLYSLCLFLFGMVGFYKQLVQRRIVFAVGVIVFVIATVYMFSLPLPNNFDFANYFKLVE